MTHSRLSTLISSPNIEVDKNEGTRRSRDRGNKDREPERGLSKRNTRREKSIVPRNNAHSSEPIWNRIVKGDCTLHIGVWSLHIIQSDSTLPKLFQPVRGCYGKLEKRLARRGQRPCPVVDGGWGTHTGVRQCGRRRGARGVARNIDRSRERATGKRRQKKVYHAQRKSPFSWIVHRSILSFDCYVTVGPRDYFVR